MSELSQSTGVTRIFSSGAIRVAELGYHPVRIFASRADTGAGIRLENKPRNGVVPADRRRTMNEDPHIVARQRHCGLSWNRPVRSWSLTLSIGDAPRVRSAGHPRRSCGIPPLQDGSLPILPVRSLNKVGDDQHAFCTRLLGTYVVSEVRPLGSRFTAPRPSSISQEAARSSCPSWSVVQACLRGLSRASYSGSSAKTSPVNPRRPALLRASRHREWKSVKCRELDHWHSCQPLRSWNPRSPGGTDVRPLSLNGVRIFRISRRSGYRPLHGSGLAKSTMRGPAARSANLQVLASENKKTAKQGQFTFTVRFPFNSASG